MAETVAVVGAGPAGVRAAETLAQAGLRPIVLDEAQRPGGQIYRQPPQGAERPAESLYGFEAAKAQSVHRAFGTLRDKIDYRPATLVWNLFERTLDTLGPNGQQALTVDRLILATGATDRVLPFPGWTLPGVFTLGAAQIALKAQGIAIGRRVALVGAGPLLPLVTYQYRKAGAEIVAVLDVTPFRAKAGSLSGMLAEPITLAKGLWYSAVNRLKGCGAAYGVRRLRVEGTTRVEAMAWQDENGGERRVACDAVGASFGLRSETQLADLAGCRFVYDRITRQWVPERSAAGRTSVPHVYIAGDGGNIGGADVAELQGERVALAVLEDLGRATDASHIATLEAKLARQARFRAALERAYPFPDHIVDAVGDDEIVCRCEGIRAGALREAATALDASEVNRLKAFTRIGMGRCQGRMCGLAAAELLARIRRCDVAEAGRLRGQPPVKPVPILELTA